MTRSVHRLRMVAIRFERIGADLAAARALTNAAIAAKQPIDSHLLDIWRDRGWEIEAGRGTLTTATLGDRWQIVM